MRTDSKDAQSSFSARASLSGYIVLGFCFGIPAILSIYAASVRPQAIATLTPLFLISGGVTLFCYLWLAVFRISIDKGVLSYRTLFSGMTRVNLAEIEKVQFRIQYNPWGDWGKPRNRLEVYIKGQKRPALFINLKVFSSKAVRFLLEYFDIQRKR